MNRRHFLGSLALVPALLLGACATATDTGSVTREGDLVSGTGTIRHYNLEGGFYAIRGDDEVTYDPINLAEGFRQDGLRVRFRARLRTDLGSFHMVGPVVELLEIGRD